MSVVASLESREPDPPPHARTRRFATGARSLRYRSRTSGLVLGWALLVGIGHGLVRLTSLDDRPVRLDAVPLHGALDPSFTPWVVISIATAALALRFALPLARTLAWRQLLGAAWLASASWALALAVARGPSRIAAPLDQPTEYLAVLPEVGSLGAFLSRFTTDLATFPVHVQGHPPGFVAITWMLDRLGFGGALPAALLCVTVGALAAPAALVAVREVAGTETARRAAPWVALAPTALWLATSADAFYAGLGAVAVALVVVSTGRRDVHGDRLAVGGGLLLGVCAFLSYGLVLLGVIPLAVAVSRRRVRPIVLAATGAVPVTLLFLAAGFWWFDGLGATGERYFAGIASSRPYEVFVIANLAALAVALGPALAPALVRLRDRRLWLLVGGALLAIALADLSGMSKKEVERIWLPFTPFVLVAGATLVPRVRRSAAMRGSASWADGRVWLGAQLATGILVESLIRTPW